MKKISLLFTFCLSLILNAQFTSPGTGITYTLTSLSAAAPTVLVNNGTSYTMTANVTIAGGDTLLMDENTTLTINPGIKLTVAGTYNTTATSLTITSGNALSVFNGIQFDAGSTVAMRNTTLEYGGGIRVSTGNFLMDNCIVRDFKAGLVTSGTMSFSTGSPIVQNSQFLQNDYPAFSSAANATVSAVFQNNYLFGNSKLNTNRPQINMGPGGADSLKIINNTILGNRALTMVGGISASALIGGTNRVKILNNTIKDNRYGITMAGSSSAGIIKGNIIEDNDSQNLPNSGGSGISLSATSDQLYVTQNQIRRNLWGITLLSNAQVNLGSDVPGNINPGQNIFKDNGNGGNLYALFNNTPNTIQAKFNCWRETELSTDAMVESVISHQADDPALGPVIYSPYNCSVLKVAEAEAIRTSLYPNPSDGHFIFESAKAGNLNITDLSGRLVYSALVQKGKNSYRLNVPQGVYMIVFISEGQKISKKLIIRQ